MRLTNLTLCGAILAAAAGYGRAQTQVDLRTQSKSVDFSAASSTKPMQTGATLPGTCSVGAMFLSTSAPAGQNLYACTAANMWSVQGGATPSPAGNTNKVLSNNGSTILWQAVGGDAAGPPGALTVTGIQGRNVAATAPASGQVLTWNAAASQWGPNNPTGTSTGGGAYSSSFTSATSVTIAGTAHQLNTANLLVACYDTETPEMEVDPNSVSVNAATFDVTVTFTSAQSGRCVVSSGGGGGGINPGSSNTYSPGAKQTMAASATTAGLNLVPGTLPTSPVAGDMAVDASAGNVLKTYNGAAWVAGVGGGGAYASTFTSQTSVTITGAAHQLNTANLVVNCYDTGTPAMEVEPNTVSVNLTTYDVTISFAQAQSGRCVVSSGGSAGSGGGTGGGGATVASQLGDLAVVSSNSTTLTIGGACSAATPCNVRVGNQTYSFTTSATATLTSGTGTAYFYVDVNGQLTVGHNLALTCAGCVSVAGITGFPVNTVPLFTWLATNGTWYSGGPTDHRAFLGSQNVTAGTGIAVANNASTMVVGVDTAVVPTYLMASATLSFPSIGAAACAADQTFSLPGAAPGDAVAPGWPAGLPAGVMGTMWISASGTVSVRLCNLSGAAVNAASNTYTAADVRSF